MVHDGVSFIFAPSCTLCQRALCLYGAQSVRTETIALSNAKKEKEMQDRQAILEQIL